MGVAAQVARERDLPTSWLNDSASAWLPPLDSDWVAHGKLIGGLNVVPAEPQILLAMKLIADRERDVPDLVLLFRHLGLRAAEDAVKIVRQVYPDGPPTRDLPDEELLISAREILDAAKGQA